MALEIQNMFEGTSFTSNTGLYKVGGMAHSHTLQDHNSYCVSFDIWCITIYAFVIHCSTIQYSAVKLCIVE